MGVHILFDRSLAGPRRVEVQGHPSVILTLAQNTENSRKIDPASSEAFVKVHPVMLFFAGGRSFPSIAGAVLGLAIFEVDGRESGIVIVQALDGIDAA
jgi:hypothetical protein